MLGQPQFAIMSLHDLTRNIQSETGAARHRRRVLAATIALKDQFRLPAGQARAVVANAQLGMPGFGADIDGDFTGGRILHRVIQQIGDGDAQQAGIGLQLRAFHRAVMADVQVMVVGDGHHRGGHVDHRQQGGLLAIDVQVV